jgi:alkanesulfonate monooxygenase SsuD/methylene tetrahydromethanopterin reductase-like flavin-dependent oxidoreductase (luciferase family)
VPDYDHDLLFGVFVPPSAQQPDAVLALARRADEAGLDLVSVQDHPYNPQFLEAWTLLAAIAAATSRVHVFPNVADLPLRPPAMLARQAATLDILSGGRVELGIGTGAFWDAIGAMGGPRRSPGEAVAALREAIGVIRALWTPGRGARLDGEYYALHGAKPGPFPVHDLGIWVGAYKERMLRLTGELADGWLPSSPYAPPEVLAGMNAVIDAAAVAAGRSPGDVRRLYNVAGSFEGTGAQFLQGPPKTWAEQLAGLALDEGISGFVLMVDDTATIDRFAAEVVPAVRELVAAERAGRPERPAPERAALERAALERAAPESASRAADRDGGPASASTSTSAGVDADSDTDTSAGVDTDTGADADAAGTALGVTPTPDSGVRLSAERLWNESERPRGPRPVPGAAYSAQGRALAGELVAVHDHLRGELAQLRDMIAQVAEGGLDPGAARSEISRLTMRQNQWTVGAYCESYCRLVGMHHTLEDQAMFPGLRSLDGRLTPVVDRLHAEHLVIAGVLTRVDAALVAMVTAPGQGMPELRAAVNLLTDSLLSHLSYEERELVEPLGRLGDAFYG